MKLENFIISRTEESPEVKLFMDGNISSINGRSLPENAFEFYDKVLQWIKEYASTENTDFTLELRFEYFNSSSSRYIFEMLHTLEQSKFKEKYRIIWISEREDELMTEKGEELKGLCDLVFELVHV